MLKLCIASCTVIRKSPSDSTLLCTTVTRNPPVGLSISHENTSLVLNRSFCYSSIFRFARLKRSIFRFARLKMSSSCAVVSPRPLPLLKLRSPLLCKILRSLLDKKNLCAMRPHQSSMFIDGIYPPIHTIEYEWSSRMEERIFYWVDVPLGTSLTASFLNGDVNLADREFEFISKCISCRLHYSMCLGYGTRAWLGNSDASKILRSACGLAGVDRNTFVVDINAVTPDVLRKCVKGKAWSRGWRTPWFPNSTSISCYNEEIGFCGVGAVGRSPEFFTVDEFLGSVVMSMILREERKAILSARAAPLGEIVTSERLLTPTLRKMVLRKMMATVTHVGGNNKKSRNASKKSKKKKSGGSSMDKVRELPNLATIQRFLHESESVVGDFNCGCNLWNTIGAVLPIKLFSRESTEIQMGILTSDVLREIGENHLRELAVSALLNAEEDANADNVSDPPQKLKIHKKKTKKKKKKNRATTTSAGSKSGHKIEQQTSPPCSDSDIENNSLPQPPQVKIKLIETTNETLILVGSILEEIIEGKVLSFGGDKSGVVEISDTVEDGDDAPDSDSRSVKKLNNSSDIRDDVRDDFGGEDDERDGENIDNGGADEKKNDYEIWSNLLDDGENDYDSHEAHGVSRFEQFFETNVKSKSGGEIDSYDKDVDEDGPTAGTATATAAAAATATAADLANMKNERNAFRELALTAQAEVAKLRNVISTLTSTIPKPQHQPSFYNMGGLGADYEINSRVIESLRHKNNFDPSKHKYSQSVEDNFEKNR